MTWSELWKEIKAYLASPTQVFASLLLVALPSAVTVAWMTHWYIGALVTVPGIYLLVLVLHAVGIVGAKLERGSEEDT